jgi:hypothetical protein
MPKLFNDAILTEYAVYVRLLMRLWPAKWKHVEVGVAYFKLLPLILPEVI